MDGEGEFIVKMALFQDQGYTLPYEGDEVVLDVDSILYVGVILESGDASRFNLLLRHCYATPTENRTDALKYFIIKNGYETTLGLSFGLNEILGGNNHLIPAWQMCKLAYLFWKIIWYYIS